MGSDHAPIMCHLGLNVSLINEISSKNSRFNFKKADWSTFRELVREGVSELDKVLEVDGLNDQLSDIIRQSADTSIPRFLNCSARSFPENIIKLIKERREVRKDMKKSRDLDHKKKT